MSKDRGYFNFIGKFDSVGRDGVSLDFHWDGTRLGIKKSNEEDFEYVDLKGDTALVSDLTTEHIKNALGFFPADEVDLRDLTVIVDNQEVKISEIGEILKTKADKEDVPKKLSELEIDIEVGKDYDDELKKLQGNLENLNNIKANIEYVDEQISSLGGLTREEISQVKEELGKLDSSITVLELDVLKALASKSDKTHNHRDYESQLNQLSTGLKALEELINNLDVPEEVDLTPILNNLEELGESKADKEDIPTKLSSFENDSHFITLEDIPEVDLSEIEYKLTELENKYTTLDLEKSDIVYVDLQIKKVRDLIDGIDIPEDVDLRPVLKRIEELEGYIDTELTKKVDKVEYISDIRELQEKLSNYGLSITELNGEVIIINSDLAKKVDKTYVDSKLNDYYVKTDVYNKDEVNKRIADIIGNAPENLDTLEKLAVALDNDDVFASSITKELSSKVDKEYGKGLSSNDFTDSYKSKLDLIEDGANKIEALSELTNDMGYITLADIPKVDLTDIEMKLNSLGGDIEGKADKITLSSEISRVEDMIKDIIQGDDSEFIIPRITDNPILNELYYRSIDNNPPVVTWVGDDWGSWNVEDIEHLKLDSHGSYSGANCRVSTGEGTMVMDFVKEDPARPYSIVQTRDDKTILDTGYIKENRKHKLYIKAGDRINILGAFKGDVFIDYQGSDSDLRLSVYKNNKIEEIANKRLVEERLEDFTLRDEFISKTGELKSLNTNTKDNLVEAINELVRLKATNEDVGNLKQQIEGLDIPEGVDLTPIYEILDGKVNKADLDIGVVSINNQKGELEMDAYNLPIISHNPDWTINDELNRKASSYELSELDGKLETLKTDLELLDIPNIEPIEGAIVELQSNIANLQDKKVDKDKLSSEISHIENMIKDMTQSIEVELNKYSTKDDLLSKTGNLYNLTTSRTGTLVDAINEVNDRLNSIKIDGKVIPRATKTHDENEIYIQETLSPQFVVQVDSISEDVVREGNKFIVKDSDSYVGIDLSISEGKGEIGLSFKEVSGYYSYTIYYEDDSKEKFDSGWTSEENTFKHTISKGDRIVISTGAELVFEYTEPAITKKKELFFEGESLKGGYDDTQIKSDIDNLEGELRYKANTNHNHSISDVDNLQVTLDKINDDIDSSVKSVNGKTGDVTIGAKDIEYSVGWSLQQELGRKASIYELEQKADKSLLNDLEQEVSNKSDKEHKHKLDDVEGLRTAIESIDYPVTSVNGKNGDITLYGSDIRTSLSWSESIDDALLTLYNDKANTKHSHSISDIDHLDEMLGNNSSVGGGSRTSTIVIANYDSHESSKKGADIVIQEGEDAGSRIEKAIKSLEGVGGEVKLMEGVYNIERIIDINTDNIHLTGIPNATILMKNANKTDNGVIRVNVVNGESDVLVSNLHIKCANNQYREAFTLRGNSHAINCIVENSGYYGINIYNNARLTNCISRNNGIMGIKAHHDAIVNNCISEGNKREGFYCGDNVQLNGCISRNNESNGFDLTDNTRVIGCISESNSENGFVIAGEAVINSSISKDNIENGFYLYPAFKGVCTFNTLVGDTLKDDSGRYSVVEYNIVKEA